MREPLYAWIIMAVLTAGAGIFWGIVVVRRAVARPAVGRHAHPAELELPVGSIIRSAELGLTRAQRMGYWVPKPLPENVAAAEAAVLWDQIEQEQRGQIDGPCLDPGQLSPPGGGLDPLPPPDEDWDDEALAELHDAPTSLDDPGPGAGDSKPGYNSHLPSGSPIVFSAKVDSPAPAPCDIDERLAHTWDFPAIGITCESVEEWARRERGKLAGWQLEAAAWPMPWEAAA